MAAYTQMQAKAIQQIASAYGLTAINFEAIEAGASNSNYLLHTTQGRYILTIFDDKSLNHVAEFGALLLYLAEQYFFTTRLVSPLAGGTYISYKGKGVMLKRYIRGQTVKKLNRAMLFQVGEALAKLHRIAVPDFFSGKLHYGVEPFTVVMAQNGHSAYERWLAERFLRLEEEISQWTLPKGLIHSDVFYDNVLFLGEDLQAIIDFENAMHHCKIFDLAMAIVGLCGQMGKGFGPASALVKGYQQQSPLEAGEKEALQLFVEYAATVVSCWRWWKYHIDSNNSEKADKHWQMVNIAEETRAIPSAQFKQLIFG